jgi:hypothetical protein
MKPLRWIGVLCSLCTILLAQTTQVARVSGRVVDSSGAVIPAAQVTIANVNTGLARSAQSDESGAYILTNLPVGEYRLEVTKTGFASYAKSGIVLEVNTNPQINAILKVGSVAEQITVEADAALVETTSNGVGQVIDERSVSDLPLNGRQITQLVTLSGGANEFTPTSAGQSLVSNKNYPTASAFSIAGAQGGQTLFVLDGAPHMDPMSNVGLPMPFPDVLQEFKVETSSLPANYGAQPGGVVNVVTKSGTNAFHGSAFDFVRHYGMNARNYFADDTDGLKRNQFGGAIGGPILKNKLFFYGGYQGTYESVAPAANIARVPTQAVLQGDFTAITAPTCNGGRQINLKAPFVNNKVSPSSVSPVALKFATYLPVSADPCGKVTYSIPNDNHEHQFEGRTDWQKSSRHSIFGRYFITDFNHAPVFDGNLLTVSTDFSVGLADRVQSLVLGDTFVISPSVVNSARISYSRSNATRNLPADVPTPTQLGAGVTQLVPSWLNFNVSGFFNVACTNCSPGPWTANTYQISDDLSLIYGRHQIALGGNWIQSRLVAYGNFQDNGNFTFNGQVTGLGLADLMTGRPSGFLQSAGQRANERLNIPSLYFQDNIRVNSKLNMNIGLRWDPYFLPVNENHQASIFDTDWFNAGVQSTVFPNAPVGTLFYGDKGMPGASYGFGRLATFAPRVGIVFDPRGKGEESIRAGYGIFYGATPHFLQAGAHGPFANPMNIPQPAGGFNPYSTVPGGNPFPLPNPLPSNIQFPQFGGGLGNFKLHPQPTYMQQWNLSIQKQLPGEWMASATYLGNRTVHLEIPEVNNPVVFIPGNCTAGQYGLTKPGPCSTAANQNYRRALILANPTEGAFYAAVNNFGDSGIGSYNGLLLSLQHRFRKNFSILSNYTWSHCLTENEVALNGGGAPQDPNNPRADYGNCLSDRRQVFNLSAVARTPKFASPWLQKILGNWQASPIFTASTGSFSTVTVGQNVSLLGTTDRPNLVGDPNIVNPTIDQWFNTQAFASAGPGVYGNLGRGTIVGPGAWNLDIAMQRSFPITEQQVLDFRVEAFNVLNHSRFGNPETNMNSPIFGQIDTARDPRIMQLAVKYRF